jgi:predicted enzyme related to lactoylglutathione lyase
MLLKGRARDRGKLERLFGTITSELLCSPARQLLWLRLRASGRMPVMLDVHAYIEVADTETGVAFYIAALGLSVQRRITPRWVQLSGARLPIFILGNRPASFGAGPVEIARDFTRHWTPVHLDFIVDELEPWVRRVLAAGAVVEREETYATFRMANCGDPFGNGFDLIEIGPGGYEAIVAASS